MNENPENTSEFCQAFVDQTAEYAIFLLDAQGTVLYWNPGAKLLFGYSAAEMTGRNFSSLYSPRAAADERPMRELKEGLQKGEVRAEGWQVRKDGTRFFASGTVTRIRRDGVDRLLKVVRDGTAQRRTRHELRKCLERETGQSRTKDQFLSTAAHELRTPVSAILLWTRILRGGRAGEKEFHEALEAIERSARDESELIEEMVDVSMMMSGKLWVNLREAPLAPAVEAALAAAKSMIAEKSIELAVDLDPRPCLARADPRRIQQVVGHLLASAVRSTAKNGRIELTLRRLEAAVQLKITDNGAGVEAEVLANLFDPFQEIGRRAGKAGPGLGLGIPLARAIVELHGGELSAASDGAGKGTTFTVDLPLI